MINYHVIFFPNRLINEAKSDDILQYRGIWDQKKPEIYETSSTFGLNLKVSINAKYSDDT